MPAFHVIYTPKNPSTCIIVSFSLPAGVPGASTYRIQPYHNRPFYTNSSVRARILADDDRNSGSQNRHWQAGACRRRENHVTCYHPLTLACRKWRPRSWPIRLYTMSRRRGSGRNSVRIFRLAGTLLGIENSPQATPRSSTPKSQAVSRFPP